MYKGQSKKGKSAIEEARGDKENCAQERRKEVLHNCPPLHIVSSTGAHHRQTIDRRLSSPPPAAPPISLGDLPPSLDPAAFLSLCSESSKSPKLGNLAPPLLSPFAEGVRLRSSIGAKEGGAPNATSDKGSGNSHPLVGGRDREGGTGPLTSIPLKTCCKGGKRRSSPPPPADPLIPKAKEGRSYSGEGGPPRDLSFVGEFGSEGASPQSVPWSR